VQIRGLKSGHYRIIINLVLFWLKNCRTKTALRGGPPYRWLQVRRYEINFNNMSTSGAAEFHTSTSVWS